jgi:carbon monoxide dehydrogenase subunit G
MTMLQLKGEAAFAQPPETLWQSLARPEFLCQCFPGVDRVIRLDERSAALVVRPGFSFIRGTLDVSFEFAETNPPRSARVRIHIKGIGSSAELETRLELTSTDGGTRVTWAADATQIGGLLKAVSQGLLQAAAEKVAAEVWLAVRQRVSA